MSSTRFFDVDLHNGEHGDRAVRAEIAFQDGERLTDLASSGVGRSDQGTRDLDARPRAGHADRLVVLGQFECRGVVAHRAGRPGQGGAAPQSLSGVGPSRQHALRSCGAGRRKGTAGGLPGSSLFSVGYSA
ncbi:MAG: hypothetical protein ACRDRK_11995 [Pseudonocardia sp.]